MISRLIQQYKASSGIIKARLFAIYGVLLALNVFAWGWALLAFHDQPVLLATALLAYGFGLRHAVDADHIAAIDNVTRKLMQDGQRPVTVGFFFSMGHSSVVLLASVAVAFAVVKMGAGFEHFKAVGGVFGTSVSASFLFIIALTNLVIFGSIYQAWRKLKRGEAYVDSDFDQLLNKRGFFNRLLQPLFRFISRSWHLYPLGFLFGIGFDTATEISLLGISATQASQGLSPWSVLIFPLLFSAGMSLVDTLDGHLMLGAYGWAYLKPARKIYYNMTITLVSVLVALVVGSVEALGLFADTYSPQGAVWDVVAMLNDNFGSLGYLIIGIFVASWALSMMFYKLRGFDRLDSVR
ncbi:HoxN/HupN/NixA family nickel/cobalt transporter [Pseudomonas gingeri]|uniref:Nickel/cobalt efflux system n=1 Tax=Pseudomonas gingeri TaxID=117681 RepID=A0A7Y7YJ99_9PSED|nr:HoxN/HupN/NixA family nickel/cobalt transporter [Pseudomonas gingeri]NWC36824.1 HoxN/HupN/NixA family nickel/cobalt transporter [Pseudomonas gingeri]